ncbi:hypothetical protein [Horticoccus sp. 23ND18S-11]|uniref:hypothetical protein n=1 Tax=Horticoccus sp. 23ND18S-11 TaxID=3391832 RepID=UPI0039C9C507
MPALSESPVRSDSEPPAAPIAPDKQVSPAPSPPLVRSPWGPFDFLLTGLVLALMGAAVATSLQHSHRRNVQARVVQDFKTIAAGLEAYLRDHDAAPPDTVAGTLPPGLAPYLKGMDWSVPTPAGGHYRLTTVGGGETAPAARPTAMIAIAAFSSTEPFRLSHWDLIAIDAQIDDGNLNTGNFRTGFNHWPYLVVRAPP